MCLDVCPPADSAKSDLADACRRTTLWARRQLAAPRADDQLLFGIAQGGTDSDLRRGSLEEIGLTRLRRLRAGRPEVGEDRTTMFDTVAWAAPLLPRAKPRYFMGIGDPGGVLEVIECGVDMFDCVLPTRLGRTAPRSPGRVASTSRTLGLQPMSGPSTPSARAPPAPASAGPTCGTW